MTLLTPPVMVSVPIAASVAGGGAVGGAERQVDRDRGRRIGVDDAGVAVAGDGVVAAEALELVEAAVVADVEGAAPTP